MPPGRLDIDRVLRETFVAAVEHHATLGSTNDRAAECAAEEGRRLPLLIVADEQTAGRGRGNNRWWTGPGSLTFSLLLTPECVGATPQKRSPLVALAAGVAIVEAVTPLTPEHVIGIHWPNDVMADGRKLAGVLVEVLAGGRPIVGIGINTNNTAADAPPELQPVVATLHDMLRRACDPTEILVALLTRLEGYLAALTTAPERLTARADALCLQRGMTLAVENDRQVIVGRCAGIAPDGALLLDTPDGQRRFYSGIVR
jgi:BirA family transcriptional regulator, biotin operon repressor / biotin---[acetyl-CoA-carboxylase] ligase